MKLNTISFGMGIAAMALSTVIFAAPNPVSFDMMVKYVTQAMASISSSLTAADWAAVCTSGSINGPTGCYGDVSSPQYAKINSLTDGLLSSRGITGGGGNTVWIAKYGTGTTLTQTEKNAIIKSTSGGQDHVSVTTTWACSIYTESGINGALSGPLGIRPTASNQAQVNESGYLWQTVGIGNASNDAVLGSEPLYIYNTVSFPPAYLVCISANMNGQATAFEQVPMAGLQ